MLFNRGLNHAVVRYDIWTVLGSFQFQFFSCYGCVHLFTGDATFFLCWAVCSQQRRLPIPIILSPASFYLHLEVGLDRDVWLLSEAGCTVVSHYFRQMVFPAVRARWHEITPTRNRGSFLANSWGMLPKKGNIKLCPDTHSWKSTFGASQRVSRHALLQVRIQNSQHTISPWTSWPTYQQSERNILHNVPIHRLLGRANWEMLAWLVAVAVATLLAGVRVSFFLVRNNPTDKTTTAKLYTDCFAREPAKERNNKST